MRIHAFKGLIYFAYRKMCANIMSPSKQASSFALWSEQNMHCPCSTLVLMNMEYGGVSARLGKNTGRRKCRSNQPSFVVSIYTMHYESFLWLNKVKPPIFICSKDDSAHPLHPILLTLILNQTTPGEKQYYVVHIGTRNIVERMFGWSTIQAQESGSNRSGLSYVPHIVSTRQRCWNIDPCRFDSE